MIKKADPESAKQSRQPEQSQCLKVPQVAEIINVDYEVAKKLMEDGAIKSFKIGTQMRTTRFEAMSFLNECISGTISHKLISPVKAFIPQTRHRKSA